MIEKLVTYENEQNSAMKKKDIFSFFAIIIKD